MSAKIEGLTVAFGETIAVHDIDLHIPTGERFGIMGPSGSGKSTLLRAIAGLDQIEAGAVIIDGIDMESRPTHLRPIGLMFQEYALFPHLSVKGNIAYGLRMNDTPRIEVDLIVTRLLEIAGLDGFEDRTISSLSGGERQRVALVRTLAPQPSLVMLDEPLGSLDLALRESLLAEMRSIIVDLGTTALYVTHDRSEAFAFADRVAIMRSGHIVRVGTPAEVWLDPRTDFVARFLGHSNVVDGAVVNRSGVTVLIPMDAVSIRTDGQLETTVLGSTFADGRYIYSVETRDGINLRVVSDVHLEQGVVAKVAIALEGVRTLTVDEI